MQMDEVDAIELAKRVYVKSLIAERVTGLAPESAKNWAAERWPDATFIPDADYMAKVQSCIDDMNSKFAGV